MATRKDVRPDSAIVKRGAPLAKKRHPAMVADEEALPPAAEENLRQGASLATELLKAHAAQERADPDTKTAASGIKAAPRTLPCQKYNLVGCLQEHRRPRQRLGGVHVRRVRRRLLSVATAVSAPSLGGTTSGLLSRVFRRCPRPARSSAFRLAGTA